MTDVQPYPLSWPAGRPRTPDDERIASKFGTMKRARRYDGTPSNYKTKHKRSFAAARDELIRELDRIVAEQDEENVVLSTNVRLRLDGKPSGSAGEPKDPGVAVYFVRRLESGHPRQYTMCCDKYERVADNCYALAITLEAMRKIERHGSSQLMEQAFSGFAALPPAGKRHWSYVLGIGAEYRSQPVPLVLELVRQKYRELIVKKHSDVGTEHEHAVELNDARDCAVDELENAKVGSLWAGPPDF